MNKPHLLLLLLLLRSGLLYATEQTHGDRRESLAEFYYELLAGFYYEPLAGFMYALLVEFWYELLKLNSSTGAPRLLH